MTLITRTFLFILPFLCTCNCCSMYAHNPAIQYKILKRTLENYKSIQSQGGWNYITYTKPLKFGEINKQIVQIRQRLYITGEFNDSLQLKNDTFDLKLQQAVLLFQKNHCLKVFGTIDRTTINELNIPVEKRIKQLELNVERWKKYDSISTPFIFVNLASQTMEYIKGDSTILEMKIIIGRYTRQTPILHSEITAIEFNPYWVIPPGILSKDIMPLMQKSPDFITDHSIKVYSSNKEIDPDSIDWNNEGLYNKQYSLIQDPGPKNPMGKFKFSFPNAKFVYMHDTPDTLLFARTQRTFSSGCIRLSNARKLASVILKNEKGWDESKIDSLISTQQNLKINIKRPIAIKIDYITSWINNEDEVVFAQDIYRKDD